jgi:hypothetical protein
MSDTDHVLELIDRTLGDDSVSSEAMRCVPEPDVLPDCRHERCLGHDVCQWVADGVLPDPDGPAGGPLPAGWTDVGFTTDPPFEVVEDDRIPRDRFAVLYHGDSGQVVAAGPFPAPPPAPSPAPDCGHWRCVGANVCRWATMDVDPAARRRAAEQVARAYNVPLSAVWPAESYDPSRHTLPGPTFHTDEQGNVCYRDGTVVLDREQLTESVRRIGEHASEIREAMDRASADVHRRLRAISDYLVRNTGLIAREQADRAGGTDDDETPAERALRLRRQRNTGPDRDPHRHRGMR